MHECISLKQPKRWNKSLDMIQHGIAHTWEYCYAMHLTTNLNTYLYSFQSDGARIICPISERKIDTHIDIVTPYGFSGFVGNLDFPDFPLFWRKFVEKQEYISAYIGLNPLFNNNSYYIKEDIYEYNSVYVIDLTLSLDRLFSLMSDNRKRQLKKWDDIVPNLVFDRQKLIQFFIGKYYDVIDSKNASKVYYFSTQTLEYLLNLENVVIVGFQNKGEIKSVSVFAYTNHAGDYLFNVSVDDGYKYAAALIWYAIKYMKSIDVPLLNLGGGVRDDDGIAEFKRRFGSKKLPLKSLKQIYRPKIYNKLCKEAGVDPADISGYFPAYRKK